MKTVKKILAAAIVLALVVSFVPAYATAEGADPVAITGIDAPQPDTVSVALGTAEEDIPFPALFANEGALSLRSVTWAPTAGYNSEGPGEYIFTPQLPADLYTLEEGAKAPQVVVAVMEEQNTATASGDAPTEAERGRQNGAEEEPAPSQAAKTINAFNPLDPEVESQVFAFKTTEAAILDTLPTALYGKVNGDDNMPIPLTGWTCATYDPDDPGPHEFAPILSTVPDTYSLDAGVMLPKIYVALEKTLQQLINDAAGGTSENPASVHISAGTLAAEGLTDILQIADYDGKTFGDPRHIRLSADPGVELSRAPGNMEQLIHVNPGSTLVLENITLTGETIAVAPLVVTSVSGSLTLGEGALLQNNHAGNNAGAIDSMGSVVMETGSLIKNCAGGEGGAIYSKEGFVYLTGGAIQDCTADNNGGAIFSDVYNYISMTDGLISGCSASNGGAIFSVSGQIDMTGGRITNNTAEGGGGAIVSSDGVIDPKTGEYILATCTLQGGEISWNTAQEGGGVHNYYNSTLMLAGTNIIHNTATVSGGGIASAGTMFLEAGRVDDNTAEEAGGGVLILDELPEGIPTPKIHNDAPTLAMNGGSISGNRAGVYGGGIAMNAYYRESAGTRELPLLFAGGTIQKNTTGRAEGSAIHLFGNNAANVLAAFEGTNITGNILAATPGASSNQADAAATPAAITPAAAATEASAQKQLMVGSSTRVKGVITLAQGSPLLLESTPASKIRLNSSGFASQNDFASPQSFAAYQVGDVVGRPAGGYTLTPADVQMVDAGVPLKLQDGEIVVAGPSPNPDPTPAPHTGDNAPLGPLALLATLAAGLGLGMLLLRRRRDLRQ